MLVLNPGGTVEQLEFIEKKKLVDLPEVNKLI